MGKVWTGKRQVEDCESWGGDVLVVSEDHPSIFRVSGLFSRIFSGQTVLSNFKAVQLTQWKKVTFYLCIFYWTLPGSNTHKKTYGFNDLEHCIEVINVTNAYEQEKIELLRDWKVQ